MMYFGIVLHASSYRSASGFRGRFANHPYTSDVSDVAREFQAGMTPSLTKWSRITRGLFSGSKWQLTASRIMVLSCSRVSA